MAMQVDHWNWPPLHSNGIAGGNAAIKMASAPCQNPLSRLFNNMVEGLIDRVATCPWFDGSGADMPPSAAPRRPLYTPAERLRRDSTGWTMVQAILAPIQFAVFLVSLGLVLRYLATGDGYGSAAVSVVVKTMLLYAIMITGAIWEKAVFGKYLFADAFFWEDAVSMLVIALHTAYLAAMLTGWGTPHDRMVIALAAYASYAINATQFLLKLRAARLESPAGPAPGGAR
jgi:3-vinyl bacteriochlorophyllide hydratase